MADVVLEEPLSAPCSWPDSCSGSSSSSVLLAAGEPAGDRALTDDERPGDRRSSRVAGRPARAEPGGPWKGPIPPSGFGWSERGILYTTPKRSVSGCNDRMGRPVRGRKEATVARDIAVAAVLAFSTGVMSGAAVATLAAIRSERRRDSRRGVPGSPGAQGPACHRDRPRAPPHIPTAGLPLTGVRQAVRAVEAGQDGRHHPLDIGSGRRRSDG